MAYIETPEFNPQTLSKGLYRTLRRLLKAPTVISRKRKQMRRPSLAPRDFQSPYATSASDSRGENIEYKFDINLLSANFSRRKKSNAPPIILADSVAQFQDLVDTLYDAAPNYAELKISDIERLLDIAEVAYKHNLLPWVACSLQRICSLANDPTSSFRSSSADLYTRILTLSTFCHFHKLTDAVSRTLVVTILWHNFHPDRFLLSVAEAHGLRRICGVAYYRQLTSMPQTAGESSADGTKLVFPSTTDIETRMRLLSAHHSLSKLWEHIQRSPPCLHCDDCHSHPTCISTWRQMWFHASHSRRVMRIGSADVLGRLKEMVILLRKMTSSSPQLSLQCSLAALEAVAALRDEIVEGLVDHFRYC